jgi:hypothetical protein
MPKSGRMKNQNHIPDLSAAAAPAHQAVLTLNALESKGLHQFVNPLLMIC